MLTQFLTLTTTHKFPSLQGQGGQILLPLLQLGQLILPVLVEAGQLVPDLVPVDGVGHRLQGLALGGHPVKLDLFGRHRLDLDVHLLDADLDVGQGGGTLRFKVEAGLQQAGQPAQTLLEVEIYEL